MVLEMASVVKESEAKHEASIMDLKDKHQMVCDAALSSYCLMENNEHQCLCGGEQHGNALYWPFHSKSDFLCR
jgi:hypothetical protein